jgi:hypothetical protein
VTRPLLVGVAHGLDYLTFLMAVSLLGIGGESNGLMQMAYLQVGLGGVAALKASGATALALMSTMRSWVFVPAASAGLFGASINLIAIGGIR